MKEVSKITEAIARLLAEQNLDVFTNEATPPDYITYKEIAKGNLKEGEYEAFEISAEQNEAYGLLTYHFINYDESNYPVRQNKKPFKAPFIEG